MNRRLLVIGGAVILLVIAGAVARNQVRVYRNRQARGRSGRVSADEALLRRSLFELLQPVELTNCRLARFGEANDGGYLMCANLLGDVEAGYSYGISGYDKWGCDISTTLKVRLHQ